MAPTSEGMSLYLLRIVSMMSSTGISSSTRIPHPQSAPSGCCFTSEELDCSQDSLDNSPTLVLGQHVKVNLNIGHCVFCGKRPRRRSRRSAPANQKAPWRSRRTHACHDLCPCPCLCPKRQRLLGNAHMLASSCDSVFIYSSASRPRNFWSDTYYSTTTTTTTPTTTFTLHSSEAFSTQGLSGRFGPLEDNLPLF